MKQSVFLLLNLFLILLVACNPAQTESAGQPAGDNLPPLSSEALANIGQETNADTAVSPLTTAFDPTTAQTDAKGVPVGWTEDGHPYRGNPNAPVVMKEFSDFQCPFCSRFYSQTLGALDENQIANGELMLVYYEFPLTSIHLQAFAASNAALCAGEQNIASYWAMHDVLFANQQQWSVNNPNPFFNQYAKDLGLDINQFNECLVSDKFAAQIEADLALGQSLGVNSTPHFFLNDQPLVGAQPLAVFNEAITAVLNGEQLVSNVPTPQPTVDPSLRITPVSISADGIAATMGDPNAPVTIVEYTDYQCPYCLRYSTETLPQLLSKIEAGEVYYILKDFPLESIHPQARIAAVAARCAGEQGAYWEMHDAVFNSQQQWSGQEEAAANVVFAQLATDLGLEATSYAACLTSGNYEADINISLNEGASLGIQGTPHFFISGFPVSGAQPYELFDYAISLAKDGTLADAYSYQPAQQAQPTPTPSGPVEVSIEGSFSIGDPDAPITIVEFTDYQCPFCYRHFLETFGSINENYVATGQVRYVFKEFPLTSIHPQAFEASEAALCAGDEGAYLEMHDVLFTNQQEWSGRSDAATLFVGYAEELGLDKDGFADCMSSHKYKTAVEADMDEGFRLGVSGTPAFFLNGYPLFGAQPYNIFEQAIQQLSSQ